MKDKIIVIVGPTAVGKTKLGIELAKAFDGEVINGDSMQVYRGLDIGTAKVTPNEAEGIVHHLIDIKDPAEPYSVSDFKTDAAEKIKEITARKKIPIIVGGTGLYVESLLFDVSHGGEAQPNQAFRQRMQQLAEESGKDVLHRKLTEKDPEAAAKIHPNNVRRVIRALEVIHETGEPFSSYQSEKVKTPLYDTLTIGLTAERTLLYERIEKRVDLMMEAGLLNEAKELIETVSEDAQSIKGIGYKEFIPYSKGDCNIEEAVQKVKQHSRNYAKRQLTWFRNRFDLSLWADLTANEQAMQQVFQAVKIHIGRD
ncbi:tRNA dimethylallyltransferase [Alkalibacterium sp. AK22]|uniref:tRNA (adenosine(37)-N6)-dimethylallyltransferase MiaA n=1 Tax=Alkalibacterium sp. AK22 TaxID=1229520 RepID=UPI00044D92D0|nr:tRNA (adenosine(37)-N6)-dimethylallyltransferase MiaA [Alkalibacterium sp. AK22]EXJ22356.1 tRNA dimethylallyltransferase [Alkalibacterium sp. AK22]